MTPEKNPPKGIRRPAERVRETFEAWLNENRNDTSGLIEELRKAIAGIKK